MSRRSDIVRSDDQSHAVAVHRELGFNWNAMLVSDQSVLIAASVGDPEWQVLPTDRPRHTSLGDDKDFDDSDFPNIRIRIPRTAIYSISGRCHAYLNEPVTASEAALSIWTNSIHGPQIDEDRRRLFPDDRGGSGSAADLHVSHAGHPLEAGDLVWLLGLNTSDLNIAFRPIHLSATYEAEIGTVHPLGETG